MPSDYCVVLLYSMGSTAFTFLMGCGLCQPQAAGAVDRSPGHGQAHGQAMDRLNNEPIHRWPCLKISTLSISTSPVTVQLSFMLSDYRAMLFWWVLFVTLVFDGVRWTGAWTGAWTRAWTGQ